MKKQLSTLLSLSLLALATTSANAGDTLDQIEQTKELRIGVTGDYMPFSERLENDSYVGIEHDLGKIIAEKLDVKLTLVKTSWPTLMSDLQANKYDIGMSGISVNDKRKQHAYFSSSYYNYGKSPITLCENVAKYDSLEKIDQASTTVIINEGGTNAAFARANLKQAKLHVEPTNKYVYDRILDGTVDLMITDSVEADYRSRHYDELCRSMPDSTFTKSSIAAMMPKDKELQAKVNAIINELTESGKLAEIIDKNMSIKL